MIAALIRWSLANRLVVVASAVVLLAWGGYRTLRMPVDVFPDLTAPTVTVLAEAPGLAPTEMETLVTLPLETAVNGAAGIRRIRSSTSIGAAIVWVEFDWGTNIYKARQVVAERLRLAASSLPPEVQPPVLAPITSIMGEVMYVALRSDHHDLMTVKTVAEWTVRRRLLAVPGVAQVVPTGGDTREYQVLVDPVRLAAHRIGLSQVTQALAESNTNTSAGFMVEHGQEYLIYGLGRVQTPADIGETVLALRDGVPVRVRDVADVTVGPAIRRGAGAANGQAAVVLALQKQPDVNTLALTAHLDTVLADIQGGLPAGMVLETELFRQADFIEAAIANIQTALRDGAILVVVIVFAFLASARATAITLLAIPLSLVAAVLVLEALGGTINTMSLGGMAIAVGALVDDAIIDVENITRRLREDAALPAESRSNPLSVAYSATHEIQASIFFATLIIILVFVPLFFLSGVEGRLLAPLGLAYVVALAASLLVAVTITPVLCYLLLPTDRSVVAGREAPLVSGLKRLYAPVLELTLPRWKFLSLTGAIGLGLALLALSQAGQSFLPEFNEGSLTVLATTRPGTSLSQSDALGTQVEDALLAVPEVAATARRTGRSELAEHTQEVYSTEVEVRLSESDRDKQTILAEVRKRLALVPGMAITLGQPISHRIDHMLSGTRASIAVKVLGDDLYELRHLASQVAAVMAKVPGIVDLFVEQQTDIPFITVQMDRAAIARHGLRIQDVASTIDTAFRGKVVSRVIEGQTSFDLLVRYPDSARDNLEAVGSTLIITASGAELPLRALAEVRRDRGPNTVSRENVQRVIVVSANVAGRDLRSVVDDVQTAVSTQVGLPAGYRIAYGGQFESAAQASRTLLLLGALVVAAIYLLLYVAFNSARDAALVMLNLPLALIGGVVGLFVAGGVISIATLVGFITLFGIATRNGVMLVAHARHLVQVDGISDPNEAVRRAAMERLAPILMTALAAGLALVPLALAGGEPGSEVQTPMAIVILFGLVTSTALNMLIVPAVYLRFGGVWAAKSSPAMAPATPHS